MNQRSKTVCALAVAVTTLMLSACMDHPPPPRHPGPYNDPVDAFDATAVPYDPSGPANASRPLSDDLAHLRDARSAYEHSQAVQAAHQRDEQEKCRNDPDAKLVRIQDGTSDPDAVYCQRPATGSSDDGS